MVTTQLVATKYNANGLPKKTLVIILVFMFYSSAADTRTCVNLQQVFLCIAADVGRASGGRDILAIGPGASCLKIMGGTGGQTGGGGRKKKKKRFPIPQVVKSKLCPVSKVPLGT